jgi:hypothetical protein
VVKHRIKATSEGGAVYPQVRQFETRALETEADARLAWERRAAARRARLTETKQVGWSRMLSTGRPVLPAIGDCRD